MSLKYHVLRGRGRTRVSNQDTIYEHIMAVKWEEFHTPRPWRRARKGVLENMPHYPYALSVYTRRSMRYVYQEKIREVHAQ